MDRTALMPQGGYGRPVVLLSRDLVGFDQKDVRVLKVEAPARAAEMDSPAP
ncbi:hypothetical protein [Paracoccus sp. ME4]|uniref:hypothetical protein n=1 Tax=Paracoccus sp. ME4 TaxID=3138066 RepID=UPI00398A6C54